MNRFNIDNSAANSGESPAMRLGAHLHREGARDFLVNDASGFFAGVAVVGTAKAICITLLRDGRHDPIGLNICLTNDDAQQLEDTLRAIRADLEAEAAAQFGAAIRKAGGRIAAPSTEPHTAPALSLDADGRAGCTPLPLSGGAPGFTRAALILAGLVSGLAWIGLCHFWSVL